MEESQIERVRLFIQSHGGRGVTAVPEPPKGWFIEWEGGPDFDRVVAFVHGWYGIGSHKVTLIRRISLEKKQ